MEWLIAKLQSPKEIIDFLDDVFEIMEIRRKVGEIVSVEFSVRSNEGNHAIPHVHAAYGEDNISIAIESGEILAGNLPGKKQKKAVEWVMSHQQQLLNQWKEFAISAVSHTTKSRLGTCFSDTYEEN